MTELASTERTRIRREPQRSVKERAVLHEIIDQAFFAHVGFLDKGPMVIPTLCWRVDEFIFIHGSIGSRMIKCLIDGQESCTTFTLLDGIVLARSPFYHSANYRSAVVLGKYEQLQKESDKELALKHFMDQLVQSRWQELRPMTEQELNATAVLRLPLNEASVKMRKGGPGDPEKDINFPIWTGVYPVAYQVSVAKASDTLVGEDVAPVLNHPLAQKAD